MRRRLWYLQLFILVFTPLAFGTVEQWSIFIMEALSIAALLILLISGKNRRGYFYSVPGLIPLLLLLCYLVIQIIPLPPSLLKLLSPETYKFYRDVFLDMDTSKWLSISIHRKETLKDLMRLSGYISFYILSIHILSEGRIIKKTLAVLSAFFFFLSFEAILQYLTGNGRLLWIRTPPSTASPFGTYVNRNHFAGLMEMVLPVIFGYFVTLRPVIRFGSFRERLVEFLGHRRANTHILVGFFCIVMATSIFLSLSRGGIISTSLAMVLMGSLFFNDTGHRKLASFVIVFFIIIVFSVGWFGWEPIIERFEELRPLGGTIEELRLTIWSDSLRIIKAFLLTGTGAGTFRYIYPSERSFFSDKIVDHAHNDYIEILTDTGLIGASLCAAFLITVIYKSLKQAFKRKDKGAKYLTFGALSGVFAILIHSFTDFNLHIGANGLYLFFVLSLLVSFSHAKLINRTSPGSNYLRPVEFSYRMFIPLVAVILFVTIFYNVSIFIGRYSIKGIVNNHNLRLSKDNADEILRLSLRASLFDPLEPDYYYLAGQAYEKKEKYPESLRYYIKAININPFNSLYLSSTGLLIDLLGNSAVAEKILNKALEVDRSNPDVYFTLVNFYLSRGAREEAVSVLQKGIILNPLSTRKYITILLLNNLDDQNIFRALPERFIPYIEFADYLKDAGNIEMADRVYNYALNLDVSYNEKIQPQYFYRIYNFYYKQKRYADALRAMKKAMNIFPNDKGFHITAAVLYERMGIRYRALEEYKRVLMIDPSDTRASNAVKRLLSIQ